MSTEDIYSLSNEEYFKLMREEYPETYGGEADQQDQEQTQRTPKAEFSTPKSDLQKDLEEYADTFESTINKYVPEGMQSMTVQSVSDTVGFLSKRIPELIDLTEKAKQGDADAITQLAGSNPLTGLGPVVIQEAMDTLAKDDPSYRKRLEAISGDKYYTDQEIEQLPPDEQDRIRSKQGNAYDKILYGGKTFLNGIGAVLQNSYDNFSKADSVGDYIAAYADFNASTTGLGAAPMIARASLDFADMARTDPLGTFAVLKGTASAPARVRAALGKAPVKGAAQKLRESEGTKSPAEFIESGAIKMRDSESPAINAIGEAVLAAQRGAPIGEGPVIRGATQPLTAMASASLPYIFSNDSMAGLSQPQKNRIKQGDRMSRGRQGKLADDINKIVEQSPFAFSVMREFVTKNQKLMPETFEVVKNVEDLYRRFEKVDNNLRSQIDKKIIKKESVAELGVKLRENQTNQSKLDAAIRKLDLDEVDNIRSINKDLLYSEKNIPIEFKELRNIDNWKTAARRTIEEQPESFMNITYEGKPVHPLSFVLDGINKSRPMRDFDVNKIGVNVKMAKNAAPEAAEFLVSHQNAVVDLVRMAAEQAKDLAEIRRPDGRPLISERQLLANTLAGYFPEGKLARAFGETKDAVSKSKSARGIDDAIKITEDHLRMAKTRRQELRTKPPKTLEEAIEYVKEDSDAIRNYQNVLIGNAYTIEKAKTWTDLYTMLEETGKVFNERPARAGYIKAAPKEGTTIEFGPMQNKYIPKAIYENITRYDREWGNVVKGLREAQQIFKTTKTVMNAPYFYNTAIGLAFAQWLYGGKPVDIIFGMKDYASKGKYYKPMRDAGFLMNADELVGLETGNKGLIKKLGTKYKSKVDADQYSNVARSLENLLEDFENPLKIKETKKKKLLRDAGLVAVLGGGGAALAGPAGAALGVAQAAILPRGRYLSTLLDQGSRVASFKRFINTEAASIAAKRKIPKNKAIDIALKDPEIVKRAGEFALYTNIDYSYVPMGVEKMSALVPATPFIKFAHRAMGAMLAYPFKNPMKFAAFSDAHRKHMQNIDEKRKNLYTFAPINTAGAVIDLDGDSYLNIGYTLLFTEQIPMEATALPTLISGGTGPVMYGGQALDKVGNFGQRIEDIFVKGYTESIINSIKGVDRFGNPLRTDADLAVNLLGSISPSSLYYAKEMMEAAQSEDGKNRNGFTVAQLFMNSFGLKVTPKSEINRKLDNIAKSYERNFNRMVKQHKSDLRNAKNENDVKKANKAFELDSAELAERFKSLHEGDTLSLINRLER